MQSLSPLDDSDASRTAETAAPVDGSPRIITVTQPHATGTMVLAFSGDADTADKYVAAGADLGNIVLTYDAVGGMTIGAQVEVDIPSVWGPIFRDNGDTVDRAGEVTLSGTEFTPATTPDSSNRTLTAKAATVPGTDEWTNDSTAIFTIKAVKAPAEQVKYTFAARASSGTHGTPGTIGGARDVEVTAPHGSGTMELKKGGVPFDQALAEQRIGNLQFIYTAAGYMASGAVVNIVLPADTG